MLTAMNADMCSKCRVTDPCVKSFIRSQSVVATAAAGGNGLDRRLPLIALPISFRKRGGEMWPADNWDDDVRPELPVTGSPARARFAPCRCKHVSFWGRAPLCARHVRW